VGQKHAWAFDAANMSDGTLRVLGLLLALYQSAELSLIGIEEPESTVHPAVSDLLIEVLQDAANRRQILFTTHSPEILDEKLLSGDQIRVVEAIKGNTIISPLTESNREVIRRKLYTPGELLRSDEIEADRDAANAKAQQFHLFE
jgi:predicted ATPase